MCGGKYRKLFVLASRAVNLSVSWPFSGLDCSPVEVFGHTCERVSERVRRERLFAILVLMARARPTIRKEVSVMGDRINFVFKSDEDNSAVVLYSHWGRTDWKDDLLDAICHATPRISLQDTPYSIRMAISYLLNCGGQVMTETNFGIYSIPDYTDYYFGDDYVVVDFHTREVVFCDGTDFSDYFFSVWRKPATWPFGNGVLCPPPAEDK